MTKRVCFYLGLVLGAALVSLPWWYHTQKIKAQADRFLKNLESYSVMRDR